jgi:predicted  nucleic acid-binding Zn-ribbon protein
LLQLEVLALKTDIVNLESRLDTSLDAVEKRVTMLQEKAQKDTGVLDQNVIDLKSKDSTLANEILANRNRIGELELGRNDGAKERDRIVTTLQRMQQRQQNVTELTRDLERLKDKVGTCETLHYGNTGEIVRLEDKVHGLKEAIREKFELDASRIDGLERTTAEFGNLASKLEGVASKLVALEKVASRISGLETRILRSDSDRVVLEQNHGQTMLELATTKEKVEAIEETLSQFSTLVERISTMENKLEELDEAGSEGFKHTMVALLTGMVEMTKGFANGMDKRTREGGFAMEIDKEARRILSYASTGGLKGNEDSGNLDDDSMQADTPPKKRPRWSQSMSI